MPSSSGSGSSDASDSEVTWAERKVNVNDDWLGTAVGASNAFGRDSLLSKRDVKKAERLKEDKVREKVYQSRELNPNLRKDGQSSSNGKNDEKPASKLTGQGAAGDFGVGWLQKAYDRVFQQAKEQGKSPNEVAAERWGSLDKLKDMLNEAKSKMREAGGSTASSSFRGYRSSAGNSRYDRRDRDFERRDNGRDRRRDDDRNQERRRDNRDDRFTSSETTRESARDQRDRGQDDGRDRRHNQVNQVASRSSELPVRDEPRQPRKPEARPSEKVYTATRQSATESSTMPAPSSSSRVPLVEPSKPGQEETVVEASVAPLTEAEKNAIHAKIMKAEMLGNLELVKQLRDKLSYYNSLPKSKTMSGLGSAQAAQPERPQSTREIKMAQKINEESLTLKQMFMREKNLTAADDSRMFVAASGRGMNPKNMDDEYDYETKAKKQKHDPEQFHQRQAKPTIESCNGCLAKSSRHAIFATGQSVFLHFGRFVPFVPGHLFISSVDHAFNSMVEADEDAMREFVALKSSICQMFEKEKKKVIFMESFRKKTSDHRHHMVVECIPVDAELIHEVRMYFKKAILECEGEWDTNKKLVELNGRCVTRCLPKTLPYFWVSFGPSNDGFAHVIEDEENFPIYFGHEILGGVLDIEPRRWLKPRHASYDRQFEEATQLKGQWPKFNPFAK